MTAPSITVDFAGLKRLGKEYLDMLPTATWEEADNGLKCFQLAYLGMAECSDIEQYQASILLRIISGKFIEREVELDLTAA